jgi:hypothetical protein
MTGYRTVGEELYEHSGPSTVRAEESAKPYKTPAAPRLASPEKHGMAGASLTVRAADNTPPDNVFEGYLEIVYSSSFWVHWQHGGSPRHQDGAIT